MADQPTPSTSFQPTPPPGSAPPPAPAPVSTRSGEPLDYRPLAPLAVAGFCLGIVLVILVTGSFLMSIYQRAPIYLPSWIVGLAIGAAALSFIAERQVRGSEGTRAGIKLARWGMWLCLCSGLGYWMFTYSTTLALSQQANNFIMVKDDGAGLPESGFFPYLLAAKTDKGAFARAFLLTMPAAQRNGNPDDPREMAKNFDVPEKVGPGKMSAFAIHWLVKTILLFEPGKVQVEPLGLQAWEFDKGSYHVIRHYRVTTPEIVYDVTLPAISAEAPEAGGKRTWSLAWQGVKKAKEEPTELGKKMILFRSEIFPIADKWVRNLPDGAVPDKTAWDNIGPSGHRDQIRKYASESLQSPARRINVRELSVEPEPWTQVDGKIRIWYPIHLSVPSTPTSLAYDLDGALVVESKAPIDLDNPTRPTWQILHVEWGRAAPSRSPDNTAPGK